MSQTIQTKKVQIEYTRAGKTKSCYVWLSDLGSNQIEFDDGTLATPSPLDSYAHTHGGEAYQAANEAWNLLYSAD